MTTKLILKKGRPTKYSTKILTLVMRYTNMCIKKVEFPTIEQLASNLGVGTRTLYDWEKEYPDFSQTLEYLRDSQRHLLITNSLNNKYNSRFATFLLKASHGFSDAKPVFEATQNNYLNISPEVMADALKLMEQHEESI